MKYGKVQFKVGLRLSSFQHVCVSHFMEHRREHSKPEGAYTITKTTFPVFILVIKKGALTQHS